MRATVLALLLAGAAALAPPQWPSEQHLAGTVSLPYGNLNDPFESWLDGENGLQRTEYFGGMDTYITRTGDQQFFTIVPTGIDKTTCFVVDGQTSPTPLVPANTSAFTYIGDAVLGGKAVHNYQLKVHDFNRTSTYTLSVDAADNLTPVQYVMQGYDSLFGSHFDQYIVTYATAQFGAASGAQNASLYTPPQGCGPMAERRGDGSAVTGGMTNPLSVLAEGMLAGEDVSVANATCATHASHPHMELECMYAEFASRHAGQASGAGAASGRFRRSAHFVEARNRLSRSKRSDFRVTLNRFADWTDGELLASQGGVRRRDLPADSPRRRSVALQQSSPSHNHVAPLRSGLRGSEGSSKSGSGSGAAQEFSWEQQGAVEPPPDQAICGSCWAHGAAGTIASSIFLKYGMLLPHSRQELMDCTWSFGNSACDGGLDFQGYEWILSQKPAGLATQSSYGPYLGQDGRCHSNSNSLSVLATISGWGNVTSGDEDALIDALRKIGPISISIDAALPDFTFYSSGVYDNQQCRNGLDDLDHTVLLVGYGTDAGGQAYWQVRNSWSTYWGESGYIRIARAGNICGVATQPTFVLLE